jgi:hypothetical protein
MEAGMGVRYRSWAAVVLFGAASGAGAQESSPGPWPQPVPPPTFQIPAGAKVRLSSSVLPGGWVEGRVTSSSDDAFGLMIASEDSPFGGGQMVVPRASVTHVQVSLGYKRYALLGALFGAMAGAAAGAAAPVDPSTCDSYSSDAFCSRGEAVAFSAAGFSLIGALVGHFVKTERWQNVSVEVLATRSSSSRSVGPARGAAVAAQVALRF